MLPILQQKSFHQALWVYTGETTVTANSRKKKYSWRLTGEKNNLLLSFDVNGQYIEAIELIIFNEIKYKNVDFFIDGDIDFGLPALNLIPGTHKNPIQKENLVDVDLNFLVECYKNCLRIEWGVCEKRVCISDDIYFEFDRDFRFIGAVIFGVKL